MVEVVAYATHEEPDMSELREIRICMVEVSEAERVRNAGVDEASTITELVDETTGETESKRNVAELAEAVLLASSLSLIVTRMRDAATDNPAGGVQTSVDVVYVEVATGWFIIAPAVSSLDGMVW